MVNYLLAARTMMILYLLGTPILLKSFWPSLQTLLGTAILPVSITAVNLAVTLAFYGFFHFVYQKKIDLEHLRIEPLPWPWHQNDWPQKRKNTFILVFLNDFILTPLALVFGLPFFKLRTSSETYPHALQIVWQFYFMHFTQSCLFYISHRLLHTPFLYKHLHKIHHQYNVSTVYMAHYFHPFQFVFVMLAILIPTSVLGDRMHLVTYLLFIAARNAQSYQGHCGYQLPWSFIRCTIIPMQSSKEHNFHHTHNMGIFGSVSRFTDQVLGGYSQFAKYDKAKNQK